MKAILKTRLSCPVNHSLFVIACLLLLALGVQARMLIESFSHEADKTIQVLGLPATKELAPAIHLGKVPAPLLPL